MRINMPKNIEFVLSTLQNSGFKAYIVGGCVRDYLLGITPDDFDICTSARPDQVIGLFDKTVNTGIKHGTVTVIIDKTPVEVTTFRTDGNYTDSRHPDGVNFVSDVKKDLSRRDFTVNAMCYNHSDGLIDFFGGQSDLENKTMRAVGNADTRFKEDALRILRLFRFCSTLGFTPESDTLYAALENSVLLKNISAERIAKELCRAANGKRPNLLLPLLDTGAIPYLKPDKDIIRIPLLPENSNLKFFALLYLTSNNLIDTLNFLKCSNSFKKYCLKLQGAVFCPTNTRADIKRLMRICEDDIFDLLDFKSVIFNEDTIFARSAIKEIIKGGEAYKISQLAISGKDVRNKGYKNEQISEILENLLEKVTEDPELNQKKILMSLF